MLSGRGIDGELRSKFGELTEKFWQSGAKNGDLRAIYFANGEGGSGGGGETLTNLGSSDKNTKLITTENGSADKVKSLFSVCVGGQNANENGCKENNNNASVVLVGSDDLENAMTWDNLKSQSWNQTSLVRSGHSYEGLFRKGVSKGKNEAKGVSLNGNHLQRFLNKHRQKDQMKKVLCPWYPSTGNQSVNQACHGAGLGRKGNGTSRLNDFLRSDSAQKFFDGSNWKDYGSGWKYVALLSLLEMWSTDLMQINFANTDNIFNRNENGFKLAPFMDGKGKILYLQRSSAGKNSSSAISYHSGGDWEVQLCPNNKGCSSDEGLSLTMGNGKFCVIKDVCFSKGDEKSVFQNGWAGWKSLRSGGDTALWSHLFKDQQAKSNVNNLFVALVVACFGDVKNVSLTVQEPSKDGKVIFTQLK